MTNSNYSYSTLNSQLTGRNAQRRKLANHTYAERRANGDIAIRLHATDIVTLTNDGRIIANTGGWKTVTTKERINRYFPYRIWQQRGEWYINKDNATIMFADGITAHTDGRLTGCATATATEEQRKLRKSVSKYCKALVAALPLPMPSSGDCWFCSMREIKSGLPLGEVNHDTSHLMEHIRENYFVPSLVQRALEFCGCHPHSAWFMVAFSKINFGDKAQVGRFVKKYLHRQFGLV